MRLIDADALGQEILEKERQLDKKFRPFSVGLYSLLRKSLDVAPTIAAFALVFVGTEASERLKERWRDKPEDREKDREDREQSRR